MDSAPFQLKYIMLKIFITNYCWQTLTSIINVARDRNFTITYIGACSSYFTFDFLRRVPSDVPEVYVKILITLPAFANGKYTTERLDCSAKIYCNF